MDYYINAYGPLAIVIVAAIIAGLQLALLMAAHKLIMKFITFINMKLIEPKVRKE